ncbi:MAG: hypothetical protein DMG06_22045 [Acidobacteria bacterium]|nr:MAG: hypothetical protein DMG06_22045 [Acidobacteriota bacterium]
MTADKSEKMEKRAVSDNEFELRRPNVVIIHIGHAIDYVFYLAYGLIGLEIVLELAGARDSSGFKQFLNKITEPLLAPFVGLFSDPIFHNQFRFRVSYLVALFIYLLVHVAVYGLLRVIDNKKQTPYDR